MAITLLSMSVPRCFRKWMHFNFHRAGTHTHTIFSCWWFENDNECDEVGPTLSFARFIEIMINFPLPISLLSLQSCTFQTRAQLNAKYFSFRRRLSSSKGDCSTYGTSQTEAYRWWYGSPVVNTGWTLNKTKKKPYSQWFEHCIGIDFWLYAISLHNINSSNMD